jgi:hypothetical protein
MRPPASISTARAVMSAGRLETGSEAALLSLQVQRDAVVFHPGADRARTLQAGTFGKRAGRPQRSHQQILDHPPVEQACRRMGSVLQDLGDFGANSFLVGWILRRGVGALLPSTMELGNSSRVAARRMLFSRPSNVFRCQGMLKT